MFASTVTLSLFAYVYGTYPTEALLRYEDTLDQYYTELDVSGQYRVNAYRARANLVLGNLYEWDQKDWTKPPTTPHLSRDTLNVFIRAGSVFYVRENRINEEEQIDIETGPDKVYTGLDPNIITRLLRTKQVVKLKEGRIYEF